MGSTHIAERQYMHAIMKVVGVTPVGVARVHDVLKKDSLKTQNEHHYLYQKGEARMFGHGKITYVEIMDSKLHSESGTYTVTLKVNLVIEVSLGNPTISESMKKPLFIFPPKSGILAVLQALDQRVLPDIEKVTAPDHKDWQEA